MLLAKHNREVGVFDGEEDLIHVGTHVALLQQRLPEGVALSPLWHLLLRVVFVVCVGSRVKILKTIVVLGLRRQGGSSCRAGVIS